MRKYIATVKCYHEIEFEDDPFCGMSLMDQAADEFILQVGMGHDFEVMEVEEKPE